LEAYAFGGTSFFDWHSNQGAFWCPWSFALDFVLLKMPMAYMLSEFLATVRKCSAYLKLKQFASEKLRLALLLLRYIRA
jgi:hypothetical protein